MAILWTGRAYAIIEKSAGFAGDALVVVEDEGGIAVEAVGRGAGGALGLLAGDAVGCF